MQKKKKNILLVNNTGSYILKFRLELISKLQAQGYSVHAAFPFDGAECALEEKNVQCSNLKLNSYSKNIIQELKLIIEIIKITRRSNIDLLLPFTIKPVLYSSFAAFFCSSKVISTITGMGKIYTDTSFKYKVASKVCDLMYRVGFLSNAYVIFQNPDDRNHFLSKRIVHKHKAELVNGSGINLKNHAFQLRDNTNAPSFIMVGRILKEKGVVEYCKAAAGIKKDHDCTFTLVGGEVSGKELSIDGKSLTQYCADNGIDYLGQRNDIADLLKGHTIFVLPSYREGTPRSSLEALASGMPIITTNAPGTKETVKENYNGLLVDVKSIASLESAINKIIKEPNSIKLMSKNSRALAETKFDVEVVTSNYLKIINSIT